MDDGWDSIDREPVPIDLWNIPVHVHPARIEPTNLPIMHFPCGVMCSHMVYVGYRTFSLLIWILISSSIEPSTFS